MYHRITSAHPNDEARGRCMQRSIDFDSLEFGNSSVSDSISSDPSRYPSLLSVDTNVSSSRRVTRAAMAPLLEPGIVVVARITRSAANVPPAPCRALRARQTVARTSRRNISVESCRRRKSGLDWDVRSIGSSGSGVTRGRETGGVVRRWYASERKSLRLIVRIAACNIDISQRQPTAGRVIARGRHSFACRQAHLCGHPSYAGHHERHSSYPSQPSPRHSHYAATPHA